MSRNTLLATTKRQNTSHKTHSTKHHKFTLTLTPPSLQTETANVVVQQHSRKLLKMGVLMLETCWVSKKKNKNSKWHLVVFFILQIYIYIYTQAHTHTHICVYTNAGSLVERLPKFWRLLVPLFSGPSVTSLKIRILKNRTLIILNLLCFCEMWSPVSS